MLSMMRKHQDVTSQLRGTRLALVGSILVGCMGCDRTTKDLAEAQLPDGQRLSFLGDCVRFERVVNPGSFLSLGAGLPERARAVIFTWFVALLVATALVAAVHRRSSTWTACAAAFVAAGGAGNLWDRIASKGSVTDFMNIGIGSLRTGIFNVADLAIVAGIVLFVLHSRKGVGRDA